jgi:glycosyltransferase involved in cell wall biosynthesis
MQLSDAILFYTDKEVDEYLAAKGGSHKAVLALNNGIETQEIVRLRQPYVPSSRPRDLLFIGRLTPKAELALLLDALSLPGCTTVRLDVIGGGEVEASLRRRCAELGIAGRVAWHGGTVDEQRIAKIANSCKAFVYPGSVGLSLIHGLTYGLPAIVHDDRWRHMPEIAALHAGENGVMFKQGDAASLAQAVAALLAEPERLTAMSAAAIATTSHSFNAADMTDRFFSAINAVQTK